MSLEKLIVISSLDKDTATDSNSDFIVSLQEKYYTQGINQVQVVDVSVPNVFYNIRATGSLRNNRLLVEQDGIYTPINIPEGQYVISQLGSPPANDLLTTIEGLLNPILSLSGASVSLDFDPVSQKIIWTWTPGSLTTYGFVPKSEGNLMADVLGIAEGDESQSGNLVQTPSYTPALGGLDMVYVQSKEVGEANGIDGDFGLIPLVCAVSLSEAPFGAYAYKQNNDSDLAQLTYDVPRNLNRISITLRDVDGNKLDIGTNIMTITLKCYLSAR
jgi:hypothetical protein